MKECDIIACEDTRNTGHMLKMIHEKRIRENFNSLFETSFQDFEPSSQKNTVSAEEEFDNEDE